MIRGLVRREGLGFVWFFECLGGERISGWGVRAVERVYGVEGHTGYLHSSYRPTQYASSRMLKMFPFSVLK